MKYRQHSSNVLFNIDSEDKTPLIIRRLFFRYYKKEIIKRKLPQLKIFRTLIEKNSFKGKEKMLELLSEAEEFYKALHHFRHIFYWKYHIKVLKAQGYYSKNKIKEGFRFLKFLLLD